MWLGLVWLPVSSTPRRQGIRYKPLGEGAALAASLFEGKSQGYNLKACVYALCLHVGSGRLSLKKHTRKLYRWIQAHTCPVKLSTEAWRSPSLANVCAGTNVLKNKEHEGGTMSKLAFFSVQINPLSWHGKHLYAGKSRFIWICSLQISAYPTPCCRL